MRRREFIKAAAVVATMGLRSRVMAAQRQSSSASTGQQMIPLHLLGKTDAEVSILALGGGNGCLVTGNPFKKVLQTYHDETSQQVDVPSLIRYTLGLPISVAVIGVASIDQLKANIAVVKEARPMTVAEREELENVIS